jgi:hypothetical protein
VFAVLRKRDTATGNGGLMPETGAMKRLKPFFPGAKWARIDGRQNPGALDTHVSYKGRTAFCELKHFVIRCRTDDRRRWVLRRNEYAWIMDYAETGACVKIALSVTQLYRTWMGSYVKLLDVPGIMEVWRGVNQERLQELFREPETLFDLPGC